MDNLQRAREDGTYGRTEAQELPLIRRGSFKVAYNNEMVFLLIAVGLMIAMFIGFLPLIVAANNAYEMGDISYKTNRSVFTAVLLIIEVVFGAVSAFIFMGRNCEYSAEETEFVVKGPGGKTEYFYYSDVQDIDFQPFKLFGNQRGYIVTITTSVRVIEYRVIFGENKVVKDISGNPFYYLGVNSNIITTENSQIDTDVAESMFESMMVEQITRKNYEATENDGLKKGDMKWRR